MDRRAWQPTVHGVTQNWTLPKRLSTHTHLVYSTDQRMKIVIWITSACTPSFLHSWTPVSREQQRPLFFSLVPTSQILSFDAKERAQPSHYNVHSGRPSHPCCQDKELISVSCPSYWQDFTYLRPALQGPWLHPAAAAKSPQSCPTLCNPIDGSPEGSSIHGIFQARVLEWGAIAFSGYPLRHP